MYFKSVSLVLFFSFLMVSCGSSDFQRALNYQKDGEYDSAISLYNRAIAAGQHVSEAEKNKGDIFFGKKDLNKAFACYKHSIEVDPETSMEYLSKFLSDHDRTVRDITKHMLTSVGNDATKAKIFEMLGSMLKSDKQYKKLDALNAIADFGNDARPVIKDVVGMLDDDNVAIVEAALKAIPSMAGIASENGAFEKILKIVNGSNEILSAKAMDSISNMAGGFAPYTDELIGIYKNNPVLKNKAKMTIEKMNPLSKEDALKIKKYLTDENDEVRKIVVRVYEKMGQGADIFVPSLILLLNDKNNEVASTAKSLLDKITRAAPETVSELMEMLKSTDQITKIMAISELGNMGSDASAAIDILTELSNDENKETKRASSLALEQIKSKK